MTKRQARIIVQLTTASTYAGADFWVEWAADRYLTDAEAEKVGKEAQRQAWAFLERHGFTNAPPIPSIIAYAKANY